MWPEHEEPQDFFRYTRYGLAYLAEKAGFRVIKISEDSGHWTQVMIRFGYWLDRIKLAFLALTLQIPAWAWDKLDTRYKKRDPIGFTTLLLKD